ncbi:MAG TPA: tRNA-dihydrouridine synthase family protein, partial [Chloroflexi bacterium]|nr:tRNA-dihydrouridine synthase family protein [Chloroflexota bacterium]
MNHDQMTTRSERPTFYIGTVPIYGDLILAPMSGYSDLPYRMICREMGSAMSYVPLILDDAVLNNAARTRSLMAFGESERPVAIQMLGKEDERLLAACREVLRLEPDMIDLNLGCPARKVAGRGRGAALLDTPEKAAHLARRLVDELPVPVTVKIRLGPGDTNRNYLTVARLLEDAGVAAIAVHGRTREQGFNGRADWAAIAEIKAAVNIPVLANGDVRQ